MLLTTNLTFIIYWVVVKDFFPNVDICDSINNEQGHCMSYAECKCIFEVTDIGSCDSNATGYVCCKITLNYFNETFSVKKSQTDTVLEMVTFNNHNHCIQSFVKCANKSILVKQKEKVSFNPNIRVSKILNRIIWPIWRSYLCKNRDEKSFSSRKNLFYIVEMNKLVDDDHNWIQRVSECLFKPDEDDKIYHLFNRHKTFFIRKYFSLKFQKSNTKNLTTDISNFIKEIEQAKRTRRSVNRNVGKLENLTLEKKQWKNSAHKNQKVIENVGSTLEMANDSYKEKDNSNSDFKIHNGNIDSVIKYILNSNIVSEDLMKDEGVGKETSIDKENEDDISYAKPHFNEMITGLHFNSKQFEKKRNIGLEKIFPYNKIYIKRDTNNEYINHNLSSFYDNTWSQESVEMHNLRKPLLTLNMRKLLQWEITHEQLIPNRTDRSHDLRKPVEFETTHDMQKPVKIEITHDFRQPVEAESTYNVRKSMKNEFSHAIQSSVQTNVDHDMRTPVETGKQFVQTKDAHDKRIPIRLDKSYDLRRPVKVEITHDMKESTKFEFTHDLKQPVGTEAIYNLHKSVKNEFTHGIQSSVHINVNHDMRKPVETRKEFAQTGNAHDLRIPMEIDKSHHLRTPVKVETTHDMQKSVKNEHYLKQLVKAEANRILHESAKNEFSNGIQSSVLSKVDYNMRKSVQTGKEFAQTEDIHDMRKPVILDESHDLRWPVVEDESDLRNLHKESDSYGINYIRNKTKLIHSKLNPNKEKIDQNVNVTLQNSSVDCHDIGISIFNKKRSSNNENKSEKNQKMKNMWEEAARGQQRKLQFIIGVRLLLKETEHYEIFIRVPVTGIPVRQEQVSKKLKKYGHFWKPKEDFIVITGNQNMQEGKENNTGISIEDIFLHPRFNRGMFENDLALLRMKTPVTILSSLSPICLPWNVQEIKYGIPVYLGRKSSDTRADDDLQSLPVPIISNHECEALYSTGENKEKIKDTFLCAGKDGGNCDSESGSSLIALDTEGRWSLIGLVSWGSMCTNPEQPSVYIRISSYTQWIKDVIDCYEDLM